MIPDSQQQFTDNSSFHFQFDRRSFKLNVNWIDKDLKMSFIDFFMIFISLSLFTLTHALQAQSDSKLRNTFLDFFLSKSTIEIERWGWTKRKEKSFHQRIIKHH